MADVILALLRTLGNLREGRIWAYVLAPAAVSLALWVGLSLWALGGLVDWLVANPPLDWLVGWGIAWLAHILAYLGGWMAIFALAYLTASLLAAIIILPLLLQHLARTQYRDVAPRGKDSLVAATVNSLVATVIFVLGWLLTLPFWLIPGLSIILPMLLMAWYNRRTFAYDALSLHADNEEWRALRREQGRPLFFLGLLMAILAHIPLVGLLVPTLAALSFVHYGLESLRRSRGQQGPAIIEGEVL